jgi:ankyrin repeat protein
MSGSADLKEVTMNAARNGTVHTRLHRAIINSDVVEVGRLLATGGIDVNAIGEDEKRPLHVAAEIGNVDIVQALLEYNPTDNNHGGIDVNAADTMGSTPSTMLLRTGTRLW